MTSDSTQSDMLVGGDIIERIRKLELFSRFRVEGFLNGTNKSPFKGFTTDFLHHRQYFPGDNLKYLDWRVYGKTERLFIREYEELTNTRISVVLDVSNSMRYSEASFSKHEFAIRCAALIFYLALLHQDSFSLTAFDTGRTLHIPFAGSKRHLQRLLQALGECAPAGLTDFVNGINEATAPFRRKGLTVVLSDFMDDADKIVRTISRLRFQGSDVIALHIFDPSERELDFTSITRFHDMEDEEILVVDPQLIQEQYRKEFDAHQAEMREACQNHGFDHVLLPVSDDYDVVLMTYILRRMELQS